MPPTNDSINVVAGILRNAEGCILLAERIADPAMQGLWEFPGGKISDGESAEDALCRELSEELGIVVNRFEHFTSLQHQYSDRHVAIDFYLVHAWLGMPTGCEGQRLDWRQPNDIDDDILLAADVSVLARLRDSQRSISKY